MLCWQIKAFITFRITFMSEGLTNMSRFDILWHHSPLPTGKLPAVLTACDPTSNLLFFLFPPLGGAVRLLLQEYRLPCASACVERGHLPPHSHTSARTHRRMQPRFRQQTRSWGRTGLTPTPGSTGLRATEAGLQLPPGQTSSSSVWLGWEPRRTGGRMKKSNPSRRVGDAVLSVCGFYWPVMDPWARPRHSFIHHPFSTGVCVGGFGIIVRAQVKRCLMWFMSDSIIHHCTRVFLLCCTFTEYWLLVTSLLSKLLIRVFGSFSLYQTEQTCISLIKQTPPVKNQFCGESGSGADLWWSLSVWTLWYWCKTIQVRVQTHRKWWFLFYSQQKLKQMFNWVDERQKNN